MRLPWKKNDDGDEPELDALLDSGPALGDSAFDDDADRSSEEEDLLNQYLNSDTDSDEPDMPSVGSMPEPSASMPMASETQELPVTTPSGGSDDEEDDDDDDDDDGSVGFQLPVSSDDEEDDSDDDEDDEDDDALSDDVMSIFEEEEEVDEDLAALTQGLVEIDAAELLADARSIARKLASMLPD
ncbi:MAG: hypothetical protein QF898_04845 [SAR202 cluster bacterium]|jgi:hypothetical protein|nr:hypothetical protein [SAR202 cluster bacterium]MDP6514982.1 hypothetical protein [SAR202 cluster bacterium]MDP6714968.1 hypothetical protein [SAR202 cluster bacterium]